MTARAPQGRTRPAVLEAGRTALIPLRPLTVGEILDGAFLIVRRNVALMVGLPLVVAGGSALYLLLGIGAWLLLGETTAEGAQIALVVLMGLLGLLLLVQCLVWMTAVLCRVSLQTVLGEGFAPVRSGVTLRGAFGLFWPMAGLAVLQYLAIAVLQSGVSLIYYALLLGSIGLGLADSDTSVLIISVVVAAVTFGLLALGYGYLATAVPALAMESRSAPGWIGKPAKATTVISAFERSFTLVGRREALRVMLVFAGTGVICSGLLMVVASGALVVLVLYAQSISADVAAVLTNPWTSVGVFAFAAVVAMSALLAYVAAVQSLLYLDLRMRREGLDLAMRFDRVPVPQPSAPPLVWLPPPPLLPAPPAPPAPAAGMPGAPGPPPTVGGRP